MRPFDTGEFGMTIEPAGDVNGDGFEDVLVGARFHLDGDGLIYWGAARGISENRFDAIIMDLGAPVVAIGDVNGDGYDDIAALGPTISVYFGAAAGHRLKPTPALTDSHGMNVGAGWAAGP